MLGAPVIDKILPSYATALLPSQSSRFHKNPVLLNCQCRLRRTGCSSCCLMGESSAMRHECISISISIFLCAKWYTGRSWVTAAKIFIMLWNVHLTHIQQRVRTPAPVASVSRDQWFIRDRCQIAIQPCLKSVHINICNVSDCLWQ